MFSQFYEVCTNINFFSSVIEFIDIDVDVMSDTGV